MTTGQFQRFKTDQTASIPTDLDSAQAKLVYFYLATAGGSTADDVSQTLRMKKISVLSLLRTLQNSGHVESRGDQYVTTS